MTGLSLLVLPTSCMQEFEPQGGSVTSNQAAEAPGAYEKFVASITSAISGKYRILSDPRCHGSGYRGCQQ